MKIKRNKVTLDLVSLKRSAKSKRGAIPYFGVSKDTDPQSLVDWVGIEDTAKILRTYVNMSLQSVWDESSGEKEFAKSVSELTLTGGADEDSKKALERLRDLVTGGLFNKSREEIQAILEIEDESTRLVEVNSWAEKVAAVKGDAAKAFALIMEIQEAISKRSRPRK